MPPPVTRYSRSAMLTRLIFRVAPAPGFTSSALPRKPNPSAGNSYPWLETKKKARCPSRPGSSMAATPALSVT